jgi:Lysozyme like domain
MKKHKIIIAIICLLTTGYYFTNPTLVANRENARKQKETERIETLTRKALVQQFTNHDKAYKPENIQLVWNELSKHDLTTEQKILLTRISFCESRHNPKAENKNRNKSHDGGLFQVNSVHDVPMEKLKDPKVNTEVAVEIYQEGGTQPWNSSRKCWGKLSKETVIQ